MVSLFKHFRVHQIFGANTDVGKTILATVLVGASAQKGHRVFYLKPVSTGAPEDADDQHVNRYCKKFAGSVHVKCLFRYNEPVSPHLAAQMKGEGVVPSDDTFVTAIADCIRTQAEKSSPSGHMYIETAGGVHSPVLSGTTQAACYRPLRLPTVLIGDSRLGGISSTISAYESLLLRGYSIDAVLLFRDNYYRNGQFLRSYFEERGVFLATLPLPPPRLPDPVENLESTQQYYDFVTAQEDIDAVVEHLDLCHAGRIQELESMPRRALDTIWWPFVQHGLVREDNVTVIDSAHSDFFSVSNKSVVDDPSSKENVLSPQFDGSASWWTQVLGHAHPSLTLAAAKASGRYGHVIFPQAIHLPALKLAETLIHDGPGKGWASRLFFSDNGSTGMEVALKMAIRAYSSRHGERLSKEARKKLGVLGLKGSYHGDTIGAMNASEEGVYTCEWHNAQGYWLDPPTVGVREGQVTIKLPKSLGVHTQNAASLPWVYDVKNRLHTPLARAYVQYFNRVLPSLKDRLAALVLEPLIMGAGGMLFVDPLFQHLLVDTVRNRGSGLSKAWSGMPVIFDEVFVGLNRVGIPSSGPLLGIHPDISVYAKALTGGLVPLAVTLASESIFEAFLSDQKGDALLHGHSYTAHAVGCEVANEALMLMKKISLSDDWTLAKASWAKPDGGESPMWSLWDPNFITAISNLPNVDETMTLGSVLSIRVRDQTGGYTSHSAQAMLEPLGCLLNPGNVVSPAPGSSPFSIHYRTLGDVAYFMTSLNTSASVIRSVEDRIWQALANTK